MGKDGPGMQKCCVYLSKAAVARADSMAATLGLSRSGLVGALMMQAQVTTAATLAVAAPVLVKKEEEEVYATQPT